MRVSVEVAQKAHSLTGRAVAVKTGSSTYDGEVAGVCTSSEGWLLLLRREGYPHRSPYPTGLFSLKLKDVDEVWAPATTEELSPADLRREVEELCASGVSPGWLAQRVYALVQRGLTRHVPAERLL